MWEIHSQILEVDILRTVSVALSCLSYTVSGSGDGAETCTACGEMTRAHSSDRVAGGRYLRGEG